MKKYLSALTIFIGSFLVFGVQPMIGRTLLPVFGGTASVWVVCLCAFQVLRLAGYFYAHVLAGRHSRSAYLTHCIMLVAAAALTAFVGLKRNAFANMVATGVPSVDVLLCVCGLVGFAYILLSANASLVQTLSGGRGVYRLYAVSNFGSHIHSSSSRAYRSRHSGSDSRPALLSTLFCCWRLCGVGGLRMANRELRMAQKILQRARRPPSRRTWPLRCGYSYPQCRASSSMRSQRMSRST